MYASFYIVWIQKHPNLDQTDWNSLLFWENNLENTAFSCKDQHTRKMSTKYREFRGKKSYNKTIFNETLF